jgi:DNA-binding transcriptional LysR family regulator
MIKIEYLRYFKVTADKGSFAAAAEALHVSATSVVHGINSLEDHFGVSLFVRRKAIGITLTPDGQKLVKRVKALMLEIESIDETFKSKKQRLKGELVVGCQEGLSWCLTPRVISELSRKHPDLKIITKTTWMDSRYESLETGEVDILLTFLVNETAPPHYDSTILCQPGTVAMMRKGHPLDSGKDVHLADLADYEQVMINDGPGYGLFYTMYEERELDPQKMTMSNISTSAQSIVGLSDAVSLRIMKPAHGLSPLGDAVVYPRVADDVVGPDIVAVTHKARSPANALKQEVFIAQCQELFSSGEMKQHIDY